MTKLNGQPRAGGQPHQINRVGQGIGFVEIIDAPDQPALGVAPGAVIFHMQIPHRQDGGRAVELGTKFRVNLHPAIKCGAQKREFIVRHQLMLDGQIAPDHAQPAGQPLLISAGGLLDVHGGHHSSEGRKCQFQILHSHLTHQANVAEFPVLGRLCVSQNFQQSLLLCLRLLQGVPKRRCARFSSRTSKPLPTGRRF